MGVMPSDAPRGALAALIDDTERVNEWTDRRVAQQATDAGHNLTKSDVSYYRTKGMRTLVPAKVAALGAGLKVPAYRVALAVLSDLGVHIPQDVRTPEDAIHHDHRLSARTRETLLLLIEQDRRQATH